MPTATLPIDLPPEPVPVLDGGALCDPETGQSTVYWVVTNDSNVDVRITDNTERVAWAIFEKSDLDDPNIEDRVAVATEGVPFQPVTVPAGRVAAGAEVVQVPKRISSSSTRCHSIGDGVIQQPEVRITVPACRGPEPPAEVTFTFTATPSVTSAAVGDTIEYRVLRREQQCGRTRSRSARR